MPECWLSAAVRSVVFQSELLTRAGVGFIRVVDRDLVEMSNLARQILFDEGDAEVHAAKADARGPPPPRSEFVH